MIFRHFDVMALLNMARTFPEFDHIIVATFRQKYSDITFEIKLSKPRSCDQNTRYEIQDWPEQVNVYDLEFFKDLLQHFGKSLTRVAIPNGGSDNLTIANRLLSEYCSESVKELNLHQISSSELLQYTKPLIAVEKLTCMISSELDGNFTLNQLFPNLQQLEISLRNEMNFNYIDCVLPHLKYLKISILSILEERKDQIERFIRQNPQIRSIDLGGTRMDLLKVISEVMPDLDSLTVSHIDSQNARFGNVSNFILYSYSFDGIEKLSFSHLNSFQAYYIFNRNEEMREFFRRHSHLNRLYLMQGLGARVALDVFTADLTDLVEAIVENYEFSVATIIRFIETHPKLEKFRFKISVNGDMQEFYNRFGNDWHIKSFRLGRFEDFIFERIN